MLAAAFVSAPALAGCGGSGNPAPNDEERNDDPNGGAAKTVETFTALRIAGANFSGQSGANDSAQIPGTGSPEDRTHRAGNTAITCPPAGRQCRWRILDGELQVTNGATGRLWADHRDSLGPTAASSVGDGHWLSDDSLVGGVGRTRQGGAEGEITLPRNGVPVPIRVSTFTRDTRIGEAASGDWAGARGNVVPEDYDRETRLRLAHTRGARNGAVTDDATRDYGYLVYGAWERQSAEPGRYPTRRETGVLAAGSEP